MFRSVIPLVDAVDVELQATTILDRVSESARGANKCLVVSRKTVPARVPTSSKSPHRRTTTKTFNRW